MKEISLKVRDISLLPEGILICLPLDESTGDIRGQSKGWETDPKRDLGNCIRSTLNTNRYYITSRGHEATISRVGKYGVRFTPLEGGSMDCIFRSHDDERLPREEGFWGNVYCEKD
jgi:hypothetical protein